LVLLLLRALRGLLHRLLCLLLAGCEPGADVLPLITLTVAIAITCTTQSAIVGLVLGKFA
jgi:hypothetical protein